MKTKFDYSKVKVSWTKYDIVHITDLMESKDTFTQFYEGHGGIDKPILKAFIGVKDLSDAIPEFWESVFQWNRIDRLYFAVFLFSYTSAYQAENMIIPSKYLLKLKKRFPKMQYNENKYKKILIIKSFE